MKISQLELREILEFLPEKGVFIWKKKISHKNVVGNVAGSRRADGYILIRIRTKRYYAHRLAWFYVHGAWPNPFVDHINGNPSDNRLENLREASYAVNSQNYREAGVRSKTGILGVVKLPSGRFASHIKSKGSLIYIGSFDTADLAHEAYLAKKREVHEGCTI